MGGAPQCLRGADQVQVVVWGHDGMGGAPQCLRGADQVQVAVWGHDGMVGVPQCLRGADQVQVAVWGHGGMGGVGQQRTRAAVRMKAPTVLSTRASIEGPLNHTKGFDN